MQRDMGMIDKTLEELVEKIDIEVTYPCTRIFNMILKTRSSGKIDDHA